MFDQQNEGLPSSFKQFINKRNVTGVSMTTRYFTVLPIDRPRTTFSDMLPIHYFVKLWNNIDEVVRKLKSRNAFKYHVNKYYLNQSRVIMRFLRHFALDDLSAL